jgi:flavin-dependent dehydrogenase
VTGIEQGKVRTSQGDRAAARVLVATGKHALRGLDREARSSGYVGFKLHWHVHAREAARLAGWIELLPFAGGYAGLQLVDARTANLCLIVRGAALAEAGDGWDGLLAQLLRDPAFAVRLASAEPAFARPLTIANLPYGHIRRTAPDGMFRLGDQAAMTASLTGDGMAGALLSGRLAAETILSGGTAEAYQRRFALAVQRQVRRAMVLQRMTELPYAMRLGMGVLAVGPGLLGVIAGATRLPAWRREGNLACA